MCRLDVTDEDERRPCPTGIKGHLKDETSLRADHGGRDDPVTHRRGNAGDAEVDDDLAVACDLLFQLSGELDEGCGTIHTTNNDLDFIKSQVDKL